MVSVIVANSMLRFVFSRKAGTANKYFSLELEIGQWTQGLNCVTNDHGQGGAAESSDMRCYIQSGLQWRQWVPNRDKSSWDLMDVSLMV